MAKPYPIVPVVLCKHLKNAKPGELAPSLLRVIENRGKLHHCCADAYEAMDEAANKDGIDLAPTSWADTYRSLEMQEYGFFQRYTDKPNKRLMKQKPKIYKGRAWYLRKGYAPLAIPGFSNHNLGLAIDIADASGKRLDWLLKNALDFGFSWELQSEPWHLRYTAGDAVPERVQAWKASRSV